MSNVMVWEVEVVIMIDTGENVGLMVVNSVCQCVCLHFLHV